MATQQMSVAKRSSGAGKLCWIWLGKNWNPPFIQSWKERSSNDWCDFRMENSVLGNALEGVPEEDEDEDKPKDSNVESTEGIDGKGNACRADDAAFMFAYVFFCFVRGG